MKCVVTQAAAAATGRSSALDCVRVFDLIIVLSSLEQEDVERLSGIRIVEALSRRSESPVGPCIDFQSHRPATLRIA
ncbi:MAG: hypothetical protein ACI81R_002999, partial [Bradymonadia bacterium]